MRCLLAVFVKLCAHSGRTPAAFLSQTQSAKQAQSIQAVMDFRNGFLKDTTRVDLCLLKSIHDDIARSLSYAEEYSVIYGEGRAYVAGYRICSLRWSKVATQCKP